MQKLAIFYKQEKISLMANGKKATLAHYDIMDNDCLTISSIIETQNNNNI
jgi:hypothetical protein